MLNSFIDTNSIYDSSALYEQDQDRLGHLDRALLYREVLYPVLDAYLDPQNQSIEAQRFQKQLDAFPLYDSRESLYQNKFLKSEVLGRFIDDVFARPQDYGINFASPPSVNDKLWTKELLIHDFLYYGPVTMLSIAPILQLDSDLRNDPIYLLIKQNVDFEQITEIRVNNFNEIYYEAANNIYSWPIPFLSNDQLVNIIERIISENNLINNAQIGINGSSPIADFEHPCGYIRGSAVIIPAAENPFMTLRVHPADPYTLDDLLNFGMLSEEMKEFLVACQEAGTTIAIAGTMGSGKTTLLSALSEFWPNRGRKATIEDTPELRPRIEDLIKMRTIEYDRNDLRDIDVTRLTKACKRHSVRYVVLSEARDGSAWEILQLSQAILGTLMTFHYTLRANKYLVDQSLNTLVALSKQHPLAPAGDDIKHLVASMVQILVLVEQSPTDNIRRVIKVYYITGYDELNGGHFKYIELFSYDQDKGYHLVNICTDFEDYLREKGVEYSFKQ